MKQKLLLFVAACSAAVSSFATTHVITVADFSFSPNSITTVHVGDTVKWQWASGSHTTTSTSVPGTAAMWDQPMNSTSTSYIYVPTLAGTYSYKCTPHAGMGMTGSFVVSTVTGVSSVQDANQMFAMYPNPAVHNVHISFAGTLTATVVVTDLSGRTVRRLEYKNAGAADINTDDIPNGIYVVSVMQGNSIKKQQLVVAH